MTSYRSIERRYVNDTVVMALWSLDCPPCFTELAALGRLRSRDRGPVVVLINTDGVQALPQIRAVLRQFHLSQEESWVFGAQVKAALRYSIDPDWRGELPRSYVFQAGRRRSYSGVLDDKVLQRWFEE